MRLWLRDELRTLDSYLSDLIKVTVGRAEREIDLIVEVASFQSSQQDANKTAIQMPGYTHLQKAQCIRWSHFLLSHAAAWVSELERLRELIKLVNRSPLGCGALAGNSFKCVYMIIAAVSIADCLTVQDRSNGNGERTRL